MYIENKILRLLASSLATSLYILGLVFAMTLTGMSSSDAIWGNFSNTITDLPFAIILTVLWLF
jgi:hypothetical protein